jgi:glycosyltransferase involved in cell wall biosynthesis
MATRESAEAPAQGSAPAERGTRPRSVLVVTSEWPTVDLPRNVPFIVQQVRYLRAAGLQVEVMPFRGARSPMNYARAWRAVQRRIREGGHDLVHAQFGQAGALAAFPKRCPLVVTYHGDDLEGIVGEDGRYLWLGRVLRRVSQAVALRADATVAVSRHLVKYLPRPPDAIIPTGIDFETFRPVPMAEARGRLGLPEGRKLVLFPANPREARKRHALAEEAVRMVEGAELVVAWGVLHQDVSLYMNACDVLVQTSMHEGSPTVVKEALACDMPIVSVDVGDVRERLEPVEGCVVCPDDRPGTIAAALKSVLVRGGRVRGRETVASLEESLLTARLLEVYRTAILRSRRNKGSREGRPGPCAA